ncbi:MAG: ABC-type transport auxiliary lipoprotein family protein [Caldimonas sp.]
MKSGTLFVDASRRRGARWLALLALALLAACGSLLPKPPAQPALYVLDDQAATAADSAAKPPPITAMATLLVDAPRAAPGYDTRQIAYVRKSSQLEYFAFSEWVQPPAMMLAPMLVRAIEHTGAFRAVVRAPTSVSGDLRLETELVRLHQVFSDSPSRVRLTVRAVLIDTATRRVIASREFDEEAASASDDPAGGVMAANQVGRRVAAEVAAFCAQALASRK